MFEYVKDAGLKFTAERTKRKTTKGIVIHHIAGKNATVKAIHNAEISGRGWIGIGYNFYVRKDGTIWNGRGLEYVGAHCGRKHVRNDKEWDAGEHNNDQTVGIGFEGYYHPWSDGTPDKKMPDAQFNAGVKLIKDLLAYYGDDLFIKKHKEMPSTSTSCPGDYFPFDEMVTVARGKETTPAPVEVAPKPATTEKVETKYYRVRKAWNKPETQKGAFTKLENAVKLCDNLGKDYSVYADDGAVVYPTTQFPYMVKITATKLNVRSGASTKHSINTIISKGEVYTIIDEKDGWGKLKSGAGWISLNFTQRV